MEALRVFIGRPFSIHPFIPHLMTICWTFLQQHALEQREESHSSCSLETESWKRDRKVNESSKFCELEVNKETWIGAQSLGMVYLDKTKEVPRASYGLSCLPCSLHVRWQVQSACEPWDKYPCCPQLTDDETAQRGRASCPGSHSPSAGQMEPDTRIYTVDPRTYWIVISLDSKFQVNCSNLMFIWRFLILQWSLRGADKAIGPFCGRIS